MRQERARVRADPSRRADSSPYHHGDLHAALLRASLEILEREGEAALTLREVARRAGVSHAAPYRHFADRNALLLALNEDAFEALRRALSAAVEALPESRARERLVRAAERYVEFALEHPARYRLMFGGARVSPEGAAGAPRATFELVEGLVRSCQTRRALPAGSAEDYASMTWAIVHGVASLALNGRLGAADSASIARRLTREAVRAFLVGLAPRASRR